MAAGRFDSCLPAILFATQLKICRKNGRGNSAPTTTNNELWSLEDFLARSSSRRITLMPWICRLSPSYPYELETSGIRGAVRPEAVVSEVWRTKALAETVRLRDGQGGSD